MTESGKRVIVTGGAGELGRVIVRRFLDEGAKIAVPHRSPSSGADLLALPGATAGRVLLHRADLSNEQEVGGFVDTVKAKFGGIDVLVNAAGGYIGGSEIKDVTPADWDAAMSTNLRSAFLVCRAVLPVMLAGRRGRIVNIAAMPALAPSAKRGPYAVSKRGVVTLTEVLAEEVKHSGITANAVAPSIIDTAANRKSMPGADFSRWVPPEEIASLVLFLASDEARSINGNVIRIYGGV